MYTTYINGILKPHITERTTVLDLFAGCGGLSLGFEAAGAFDYPQAETSDMQHIRLKDTYHTEKKHRSGLHNRRTTNTAFNFKYI